MKNILVTLDFKDEVDLLIGKAVELAGKFNSKIWLMHVAAPEPEFVSYEPGPQYIRDARAQELREEHRLIQNLTKDLQNKGLNAEGLLIQGPTIEMILFESKKLNVDLIIAGHHEHGFFYNAFITSTATEIMHKSKIPVLIVPIV